jgi:hypothetical protein
MARHGRRCGTRLTDPYVARHARLLRAKYSIGKESGHSDLMRTIVALARTVEQRVIMEVCAVADHLGIQTCDVQVAGMPCLPMRPFRGDSCSRTSSISTVQPAEHDSESTTAPCP